jgi:hypothetical protein
MIENLVRKKQKMLQYTDGQKKITSIVRIKQRYFDII